jgi:thioredoxin 1
MHSLTLDATNGDQVRAALDSGRWTVACLCAAWCDTCTSYRVAFDALAERHPDKFFLWIDIEDQADVVGELDIESFPTLLMQQGDLVAFFGTVLPDTGLAHRLIQAQLEHSADALAALPASSAEHRAWQHDCNLRTLLDSAAS